jgi:mycofactocin precursor
MTDSRTAHLALSEQSAPSGGPSVERAPGDEKGPEGAALISELLVAEVSIDGICGVY